MSQFAGSTTYELVYYSFILQIFGLLMTLGIFESPMFLVKTGQIAEACGVFEKISARNGADFSAENFGAIFPSYSSQP